MAENLNYKEFYIDEYIAAYKAKKNIVDSPILLNTSSSNKLVVFHALCQAVKQFFNQEWDREYGQNADIADKLLERQKNAIIGYTAEVNYFKSKIMEYLKTYNLTDEWKPDWYDTLPDAIFHENWGLAGIAKWKSLKDSSSAKIIGDRIYFLKNGKQELQEQRISPERFEQLRKALLLKTPQKRLDDPNSEIYMLTGERIAIYSGALTKEGQPVMVFRKHVVKQFSFEEQANRHTIPKDMISFLKALVKIGYNTAFVGPVRSGKTTFLTTFMKYIDQSLEGAFVETDPEVPMHVILPKAPIMQILADGEVLLNVTKALMRSDADYLVMQEGRDGKALNLIIEMANKGTMHGLTTYHLKFIEDFCYDVANKIIQEFGGNLEYHMVKVAKSFQYIFEFRQLSQDKSKKRLKGVYEIRYEKDTHVISYHQICKYDYFTDSWSFKYDIGNDKKEIAAEEDYEAYKIFDSELKKLSELYPMEGNNVTIPVYGKGR